MDDYSKNKLLESFLAVFIKHGADKSTMRMLCGEAKINPNTVYQIFQNKEEIITSCGMHVIAKLERELNAGVVNYADDNVAIGEFVFETFKKYKGEICFCIQLMTNSNARYRSIGKLFFREYATKYVYLLGYGC